MTKGFIFNIKVIDQDTEQKVFKGQAKGLEEFEKLLGNVKKKLE